MVIFNQYFASVFLAIAYATLSSAVSFVPNVKHATHGTRFVGRDLKVETYHPKSTYETYGEGIDHPTLKGTDDPVGDSAIAFVQSKLGVNATAVHLRSTAETDLGRYAYLQQKLHGIPVANAVANVAFNRDNKVIAFGASFVNISSIAAPGPSVNVEDAIETAEAALQGKYDARDFLAPTMEYVVKEDGSAALTHVFQVRNGQAGTWYEAFVDAHSGELVSVTDFVAKATYRVLPITKEYLTQGFENLKDPQDQVVSPQGWHSDGTTTTTDTSGNNGVTFVNSTWNTTSQSSPGQFIYIQNPDEAPTTRNNSDAARVNTFYLLNTIHDITYRYGFTEGMFNFQNNNFGKGGEGNDRVNISVQDYHTTDNAYFVTPPDGQNGYMGIFLFDYTNPWRDAALENDIPTHELTHGMTNRMTGGGTARCLQTDEARGLGEGWSDAFAEWAEQTSATVQDWFSGQYVLNNPAGVRSHPYSTNATTNPLRYSSIQTLSEVHDMGEVWANMLHNVYAALVEAHGFSSIAHTNPSGTEGNIVYLHLFIDALPLQPCNPTFPSARDAWLQADVSRYGGANRCLLWKAFASRGLGVNAKDYIDDATVHPDC
ncbi:hypothetical protein K474DRAFT_1648272 [Panus rudis PR-1116 ss-1]|nr:hypothetical protein K474DRAFT_1648272 [Panus rudis PR-1116 ss-1]